MRKIDFRAQKQAFIDIYSLKNEDAKGRLISLGSALITSIYNVFITGIFQTGFLSMYGISITGVGIITFIPLIASCFSVFSSVILERIPRRKWILIASKIYFYAMSVLGTTIMPSLVTGTQARLVWFSIIMFLAYSVYALFSPGFTPWFYAFYPADNERRTRYIALNQIFASIMSSAVLLLSGVLTDAVSGSAHQGQIILLFRYLAFALVLVDVGMQACAIEYPYPKGPKLRFRQVFILPFQYRKFLACLLLMFVWNFNANLNSGLWHYHLLNHMHFPYTLINAMSVMYTIVLILTTPLWRRLLRRYSWIKTFGLANLLWVPTEVFYFLMTPSSAWMYIPLSVWQNLLNVGFNLSYANVLYMNLPEENSTAHIAFYSIGCNLFAFLGLMLGTYISSISGDVPIMLLGLPVYTVQFTTLLRAVNMLAIGWVCFFYWRRFTRDQDIADIEAQDSLRTQRKAARMPRRSA